jgi:hypothetical protein
MELRRQSDAQSLMVPVQASTSARVTHLEDFSGFDVGHIEAVNF